MNRVDVLDPIRTGEAKPGVYRLPSQPAADRVTATVSAWGWRAFHLDGRAIADKPGFMAVAGAAMSFPAYFGRNWDAFEEMICDLSWVPAAGYVLLYTDVYRFAGARPAEWNIALDIFHHAVHAWAAQDVPMYVLLANNWYWRTRLPLLDVNELAGSSS